jgi:antitoxin (DNA-binding transcriptional repressor) of toxin-antitoxin stability system
MITVGVRDLKNQLSHYLQYVKDGERVVVTEHNRIIAEIIEPERKETDTAIEQKLKELQKEGRLIPAKRTHSLARKPVLTAAERGIDWETIYNEVRADRF